MGSGSGMAENVHAIVSENSVENTKPITAARVFQAKTCHMPANAKSTLPATINIHKQAHIKFKTGANTHLNVFSGVLPQSAVCQFASPALSAHNYLLHI